MLDWLLSSAVKHDIPRHVKFVNVQKAIERNHAQRGNRPIGRSENSISQNGRAVPFARGAERGSERFQFLSVHFHTDLRPAIPQL